MTLKHKIKLFFARFRHRRQYIKDLNAFKERKDLFINLTEQAKTLEIEYNDMYRRQPITIQPTNPIAMLFHLKGRLDAIKEILNGR